MNARTPIMPDPLDSAEPITAETKKPEVISTSQNSLDHIDVTVHESPELAQYMQRIASDVEREKVDRRAQEELARLRELARYD